MEMEKSLKILLVSIVVVVILIVVWRILRARTKARSLSTSADSSVSESNGRSEVKAALPQASISEVKTPQQLSAPVLRCYDYFQFPDQGGFHVKTCGIPSAPSPTKLFIQWFPVDGAQNYHVYLNAGKDISLGQHEKRWTVSSRNHYLETDTLDASRCWSMMVTAVDAYGQESPPSQVYTTCV